MTTSDEAHDLLRAIWGAEAPSGRLAISWDGDGRFSTRTFDTIEAAAAFGTRAPGNVYVRVCSLHPRFIGPGRGEKADSHALPAVWIDCDVKQGAFPDLEGAWQFLDHLPLAPSVVVATGGGLHGWWILEEPLLLDTPERMAEGVALAEGWRGFCRYKAASIGADLDPVGDLARVLRLPGTRNHKYTPPRPVTTARLTSVRYPCSVIASVLGTSVERVRHERQARGEISAVAIDTDPPTLSDLRWLRQLLDLDPPLRALYQGQYDRKKYSTPSHADAGLASKLLYYGCDPCTVQRLMRDSGLKREKYNERRPGGDYLSTTVASAPAFLESKRAEEGE
jgi:hypothetical protein